MGKLPRLGDTDGGLPALPSTPNPYPLQNIIFDYPDNVDATHPLNLDYFIPVNCQQLVTARLSFKLRAYRTYSTFGGLSTGAGTAHLHSVGGESGHSHSHTHGSHGHSQHIIFNGGTASMNIGGGNVGSNDASAPVDMANINGTTPTADATGSSGHNHGNTGNESGHTHPVSGTTTLGIVEGAVASGVLVSFDGAAGTGALAGPFNVDQVDLDVTSQISARIDNLWHVIALQPAGFGRITAILRLTYFSAVVQH